MRRLVIVRHSLPEIRSDVAAARWRLSPEGVARARAFAALIDVGGAACVFTSPEPKAVETARVLGDVWNLPVEEVAGLREHERPESGLLSRNAFEERIRDLFARPSTVVFGSESADDARRRFTSAVMDLVQRTAGDVVIVSHGTVMALFVAAHTGADPFAFWRRQQMPFAVTMTLPDLTLERMIFPDDEQTALRSADHD